MFNVFGPIRLVEHEPGTFVDEPKKRRQVFLLPSWIHLAVGYLTRPPATEAVVAIVPVVAIIPPIRNIGVASAENTIGIIGDLVPKSWAAPEKAREVGTLVHVSSVVDQVWICSELGRNSRVIP